MKLIDRYILSEWLKMFGLLLAATMGLLLMAALYDDLRDPDCVSALGLVLLLFYLGLEFHLDDLKSGGRRPPVASTCC